MKSGLILLLAALAFLVQTPANAHILLCEVRPDVWEKCPPHGHYGGGGGTPDSKPEPPTKEPPPKEPPEPPTEPPTEPPVDPPVAGHHQPPGKGLGHLKHIEDGKTHDGKGHHKGTGKGHGKTGRDGK